MSRPHREHDAFTAIAEPTRRSILGLLEPEPLAVGVIADRLGFAQPTISQHLGALARAELVRAEPAGRERHYAMRPEGLTPIAQWLASYDYWTDRLDALGVLLGDR